MDDVKRLRKDIDRIDEKFIGLIGERLRIAGRIAAAKKKLGLPIRQPLREKEVLSRAARIAKSKGIDEKFTVSIFRAIISHTRKKEKNGK